MDPKVSIIMPVYNQEKYIDKTIKSLLNQSFRDFELIIINDGSKDKTEQIIKQFQDKRIKLFNNPKNLGLVRSLNRAIKESKGEYLARADGDDLYLPMRLEKQLEFIDAHPDYVVVGANAILIDQNNKEIGVITHPEIDKEIRIGLLRRSNVLLHPVSMIRASVLKDIGGYRNIFRFGAEDYDLWFRLLAKGKAYNIKENLVKRRFFKSAYSQKHHFRVELMALFARIINFPRYLIFNFYL